MIFPECPLKGRVANALYFLFIFSFCGAMNTQVFVCTHFQNSFSILKLNFTQKRKLRFFSSPIFGMSFFGGGEQVPDFDRYPLPLLVRSLRRSKWKFGPLFSHVTGPRRLQDHSRGAAWLTHVQWAAGCEAPRSHSRLPTVKMPAPGPEDRQRTGSSEDSAGSCDT